MSSPVERQGGGHLGQNKKLKITTFGSSELMMIQRFMASMMALTVTVVAVIKIIKEGSHEIDFKNSIVVSVDKHNASEIRGQMVLLC